MSERAPYSRVYWTIVDDEKFATIFDNDNHLATWLRLLLIADQAWPASANLPANVRRGSVKALAEAGIIDLSGTCRYRIHGLDVERGRRKAANTRDPNGTQSGPDRDPVAFGVPALDETRRDETSKDTPLGRVIDSYLLARHRLPTERQRQVIARYLEVFEVSGEQRAIQLILGHPDDPVGALIADMDAEMTKRKAAAIEGEAEAKRSKARYGLSGVNAELYAALQAREEGAA